MTASKLLRNLYKKHRGFEEALFDYGKDLIMDHHPKFVEGNTLYVLATMIGMDVVEYKYYLRYNMHRFKRFIRQLNNYIRNNHDTVNQAMLFGLL